MKGRGHSARLPERLRYLQPFRKKFNSRIEELNEGTAEGPLFAVFIKRIKDFSRREAQTVLEEDLNVLEVWLALPENENDCLQFVRGFLLVSPAKLAKRILEESAKGPAQLSWVEVDLPPDASVKRISNREEAALILRWKGLIISLEAIPADWAGWIKRNELQEHAKSKVTSSPVRYGAVYGTKFIRINDMVIPLGTDQKRVSYLLETPGGLISISASPISKRINHEKWDESILEDWFHTLQVVKKST